MSLNSSLAFEELSSQVERCSLMEFPLCRSILLATVLLASATTGVQAQACDAEPQFAVHRTANGSVRAQYNAVSRSQWRQAIHFGPEVASSGAAPRHRTAAPPNLRHAYAATGEVTLAPQAWPAAGVGGGGAFVP